MSIEDDLGRRQVWLWNNMSPVTCVWHKIPQLNFETPIFMGTKQIMYRITDEHHPSCSDRLGCSQEECAVLVGLIRTTKVAGLNGRQSSKCETENIAWICNEGWTTRCRWDDHTKGKPDDWENYHWTTNRKSTQKDSNGWPVMHHARQQGQYFVQVFKQKWENYDSEKPHLFPKSEASVHKHVFAAWSCAHSQFPFQQVWLHSIHDL